MRRPLSELIVLEAGSLQAYCRSIDSDFLNNENSSGLLMRMALWVVPNISAAGLGRFLGAVRFLFALVFLYTLLEAGASILLACLVAWSMAQLSVDLVPFAYSIYSFFVPLLALMAAFYALVLRRVHDQRRTLFAAACLAAGLLTGFCVNMRSSHLPVYAALFLIFIAAASRTFTIGRRRMLLGAGIVLFAIGYSTFGRIFIAPLAPREGPYQRESNHVIAHPLVLALGVPESPFSKEQGITWDDAKGLELARRMVPDAVYLGPGYEQGLFLYYLKLWLTRPADMRSVYATKFRLAGTRMFTRNPGLRDEPMSIAIRRIVRRPGGLTILATYVIMALLSAALFLWRRYVLVFLLWECAAIAVMLQIESSIIMPFFYLQYYGYLLAFTFLLAPILAQGLLDLIAGGMRASPGDAADRTGRATASAGR